MIFYIIKSIREEAREDYYSEANGVISSISNAGKGSKKIVLRQDNKTNVSIYFLGLGEKENDIIVNDSVFKKSEDVYYYIYRKDSLVYKKATRGYDMISH